MGILVTLLIWKRKREGELEEINYFSFFVMGISWFPLGIVFIVLDLPIGSIFFILGVVYLIIGLVNRDKMEEKEVNTWLLLK
jgi:membrane-bound ClpP family serine protease